MQDNDMNHKESEMGKGDNPDVRFDIHQQAKVVSGEMDGVRAEEISTINGDIVFQLFAQSPVLSRHIRVREFQTLVDERTKRFVGRDFIFNAIDDFLKDPMFPSGYIVVNGEPGIGKTALMAQWVKQRGYVHHFNISTQNIRSTSNFLANVCAQLIVRYDLGHFTFPPEATKDSGFLSQLLAEAVDERKERPVVILVDALDEVEDLGLPQGENRLYMPQTLPDGVFFVVTKREEYDDRLFVDRRKDIYLRDNDPRNLEDVRRHIRSFIEEHRAAMAPRIEQWGVTEDEFVDTITEKSEGNFMYLVYVLYDICDGKLTAANVDDIRNLPRGLKDYYQRHWHTMQAIDPDRFDKYYEPVVCILATVREPVTIAQVAKWTKLRPIRIREVIREWREFLNADVSESDESLYRVYHTSFQDFLEDEVGLAPYHSNIAQVALDKIPGFND
ncbi:MAG: ATP-binding protein [Chloroflexi bacterium]|nr:ATP-binding protein [Chloroflexota bacterium]